MSCLGSRKAKVDEAKDTTLELYCNVGCPFARRAMIAAREKAVEVKLITIPLSGQLKAMAAGGLEAYPAAAETWPGKTVEEIVKIKEDYKRDINSAGEVPTLVLRRPDGKVDIVSEADVLSEFLEDYAPDLGTSLMPKDAVARSKVRHWIKVINDKNGVSSMYGLLMNQDPAKDEEKRANLYKGLATFARLASNDGPYFLGAKFSLADLLLQPMFDQFRFLLSHYRGVEFIPAAADAYPWVARMQKWALAVEQRDNFKAVRMDEERYVKAYAGYAGARGVSEFGK